MLHAEKWKQAMHEGGMVATCGTASSRTWRYQVQRKAGLRGRVLKCWRKCLDRPRSKRAAWETLPLMRRCPSCHQMKNNIPPTLCPRVQASRIYIGSLYKIRLGTTCAVKVWRSSRWRLLLELRLAALSADASAPFPALCGIFNPMLAQR